MGSAPQSEVRIGRFRCTLLVDSRIAYPVGYATSAADEEEWLRLIGATAGQTTVWPTYCLLIESDDIRVLVDGGDGLRTDRPAHHNGRLLDRLRDRGLGPRDIDTVVITHAHSDHTGGLVSIDGTDIFPVFDRSRHVITEVEATGAIDRALRSDTPPEVAEYLEPARAALAAIERGPGLDRLPGDAIVHPGIRLVDLPGHSAGHTGVLVEDAGAALLYLGDALHFTFEFSHPHLYGDVDPDPRTVVASKRAATRLALERDAIVSASHFDTPFGRLVGSPDHVEFVPVAPLD